MLQVWSLFQVSASVRSGVQWGLALLIFSSDTISQVLTYLFLDSSLPLEVKWALAEVHSGQKQASHHHGGPGTHLHCQGTGCENWVWIARSPVES